MRTPTRRRFTTPALPIRILAAALALLPAGCSGGGLTADLDGPVDMELAWTADPAAAEAGQVVEFATEPAGPWTILEFLPAGRQSYRHPDLMPETTFYYRVRPLLGAASAPVRVSLPAAGPVGPVAGADLTWAEPRIVSGRPRSGERSPSSLVATPQGPDSVLFTWLDNAAGEDGQLIEVRPEGSTEWTVAMALDPDVNSVGLTTLPAERTAWFRVRAFTYGTSSNVAHSRTRSHM